MWDLFTSRIQLDYAFVNENFQLYIRNLDYYVKQLIFLTTK